LIIDILTNHVTTAIKIEIKVQTATHSANVYPKKYVVA
jgi:hypothetical protein